MISPQFPLINFSIPNVLFQMWLHILITFYYISICMNIFIHVVRRCSSVGRLFLLGRESLIPPNCLTFSKYLVHAYKRSSQMVKAGGGEGEKFKVILSYIGNWESSWAMWYPGSKHI
jgi:F0F1-type ATP synthase assembly protein I